MSRLEYLSFTDFEVLCRDIASEETGLRFSAFGPGPDGGIDGRHSSADGDVILQCKRHIRSDFSKLKNSVKKEAVNLTRLNPIRYLLFTSKSLTPSNVDTLASILGGHLKSKGDIWGQEDIEEALNRYPHIEKKHPKLLLSSPAALERILHSGLESYSQANEDEIRENIKIYVENKSFDEAKDKLENEKILIISGPPGVGKTTLARILSYYYLNDGWQYIAIRTLDEAFQKIDGSTKTIFYFDDFLGRVKLNRQSLLQNESTFSIFTRRIRRSKNTRCILTTRDHIFEEAFKISDSIDNGSPQSTKYILDISSYSREIKSQILFNHLSTSQLTQDHFIELLKGDRLKKIIDHRNYNPRIIHHISGEFMKGIKPEKYPGHVIHILDNPSLIWEKPYNELEPYMQNMLITLFFENEYYGQSIENLRDIYWVMHKNVSREYRQPITRADFDNALNFLESSFIQISDNWVSFANPSLRDFLRIHLIDQSFLLLLPASAIRIDWAFELWQHVQEILKDHSGYLNKFVREFLPRLNSMDSTELTRYRNTDLIASAQARLFFEWWRATGDEVFLNHVFTVLRLEHDWPHLTMQGYNLSVLYSLAQEYMDDDDPEKKDLMALITDSLIQVISFCDQFDLGSVIREVGKHMGNDIPLPIKQAIEHQTSLIFDALEELRRRIDDGEDLSVPVDHGLAQNLRNQLMESSRRIKNRFSDLDIESLFSNLIE